MKDARSWTPSTGSAFLAADDCPVISGQALSVDPGALAGFSLAAASALASATEPAVPAASPAGAAGMTMALRPGAWLLPRTLTLLSVPHPDWPIDKRRARDSADTAVLMKLFRRARGRNAAADSLAA
jgi:hypothetical protein